MDTGKPGKFTRASLYNFNIGWNWNSMVLGEVLYYPYNTKAKVMTHACKGIQRLTFGNATES